MTVFREKLSRLTETIALTGEHDMTPLVRALDRGRGRLAVAVASGGSAVSASYFQRCRDTLELGPTIVLTPMEFVLSLEAWANSDVWLFSAGAANPDIAAAFRRAVASRCGSINVVTVRSDGLVVELAAAYPRVDTFVLPVADPKDGFLATHSMIAMVTALLLAADQLTDTPRGGELVVSFRTRAAASLDASGSVVDAFRRGDTVVVLHDPQLVPVAMLIETSLWETGIAAVQRTDFRNFAHGRHVWAARHPDSMFVLALDTVESAPVWAPIDSALPGSVRRAELKLGHGGRLSNAVGIVAGLAVVERLGTATETDPGRPGRGAFAEAIYDSPALEQLEGDLTAAVRHKASARHLHDPEQDDGLSICVLGRERLARLGQAAFVGIVLDYDGTVVPNHPREARLGAPSREVMDQLVRLIDGGVQVGFATGRGKSAGEKLREALPDRVHRQVVMGYYNGAHLRALDVDIREDPPREDAGVRAAAGWISRSGLLRHDVELDVGRVQVMIDHDDVVDAAGFLRAVEACPEIDAGDVLVRSSHHSFDLMPRGTTKLLVAEELARRSGISDGLVLGVGDSGSPLGNDFELLSGPYGISVESVCGNHEGAWTLFGSRTQGPDALARLLLAAKVVGGTMSVDVSALEFDGHE